MKKLILFILLCASHVAFAENYFTKFNDYFVKKRFYVGINLGGGSTEWKYLVDDETPPSPTTPTTVKEGGPSWGGVIGYNMTPNLSLELQYIRFPLAEITLPWSMPDYDNLTFFQSQTEAFSLSGKFFVVVSKTAMRAFAGIGVGVVHRQDVLANRACAMPYMSGGFNYLMTKHVFVESGFQYFTGFGKSDKHPVNYFIPFVWDAYCRLGYLF